MSLPESADDGLIRALPDTLASKIAAGEVVQRPANALKELVENSLDAGASRVDVVLARAGSERIQVCDDGAGMGPADAVAAFGRHATSKLRAFEDLERLRTLGFRGEALASIAAVARVELTTRRRQDAAAVRVRTDGGGPPEVAPAAAPEGTTIVVRDLFFNVPARRAFLKSAATEFKHLVETFQALALSHPDVAFSLTHDGAEVYRLAAGSLAARVAALLGAAEVLVPVEESTSYLSVRGLVGRPERARRSRGEQYTFVNGRFVKSRSLDHAVAAAYGALLPERTFPLSVLFLDVDPRHVDVNVHPTKTEVVFDDDRGIYSVVRAVVKKGLAAAGLGLSLDLPAAPAPTVGTAAGRPALDRSVPPLPSLPTFDPDTASESVFPRIAFHEARASAPPATRTHAPSPRTEPTVTRVPSRLALPLPDDAPATRPGERAVWSLHGRFLLTPVRSGLLVVDPQAAHERILYERALDAMTGGMAATQQLLFPLDVELPPADRALLAEIAPDVRALGFDLHIPRGDGPVTVRGVPTDVSTGDERALLDDLLAQFRRNAETLALAPRDNLARSLARRSAVRAGQALSPEAAAALLDQLFACREPFADPAGRPTAVQMDLDEIDRRFGRTTPSEGRGARGEA